MKYIFYYIVKIVLTPLCILIYRPTIINRHNVPKKGGVIIVGNHTNNLDAFLMIMGPRRTMHTLAKKELFKTWIGNLFFRGMGCIPVDRSIHDEKCKSEAIDILKEGKAVGIFPEGTVNKTKGTKEEVELLPFKYGAVSFAKKAGVPIVPFAITGDYKPFRKSITIEFGDAYYLESDNLDIENDRLREKVLELKRRRYNV